MSSRRLRQELRYTEPIDLDEALRRTITWERANPPDQPTAVGILDDESEEGGGAGGVVPG